MKFILAISVCLLAANVVIAMPVGEQSNPVSDTAGEVPQQDVPLEKTSINVQDVPTKSSDLPHEEKTVALENITLRKKSVDVQEEAAKVPEEPIVPAIPAAPAAEPLNVKSEPIAETVAESQRTLPQNEASQTALVEPVKHEQSELNVEKKVELDDKKDVLLDTEAQTEKKEEELKEKEKLKAAASETEKIVIAQESQKPIAVAETPVQKKEEPLQVKSIVEHPVEPKQVTPVIKSQEEDQKHLIQQESMARKEETLPIIQEPSKVPITENKEVMPAEVLKKEASKESLGDKPDRVIREAEEAAAAAAAAMAAKTQATLPVAIPNPKPLEMSPEPVKPMEEIKKDMKEDKKQEDRATRGAQQSEVSPVVSKKVEEPETSKIGTVEPKEKHVAGVQEHSEHVQQISKSGETIKSETAEPQVKSVEAEVKPQLKSEIQGQEKVQETLAVTQEGSKTPLGGASSSEESSEEIKSLGEDSKSVEMKEEKESNEKDDKSSEEKKSRSVDLESKPELLPKPEEVKDSKETIKLEGSSGAAATLHSSSDSSHWG